MGKVRSIHGGRRQGYLSQLLVREPAWELRQVQGYDHEVLGDMIALYTISSVRVLVILRSVPPESEWEALDTWVLSQVDVAERCYLIDYFEGCYITGVEGESELSYDDEYDQ